MTHTAYQADPASELYLDQATHGALKRAIDNSGLDFDTLASSFTLPVQGPAAPKLLLPGYFRLLDDISKAIGDEALNLSQRPLMPGALQFAMAQARSEKTLEQAMKKVAHSFNLLHGGEFNHVFFRDHCLVYEIVIDDFPYPDDVSIDEQNGLMECILILMHFMFSRLTRAEDLDEALVRVRTRRSFDPKPDLSSQLGFWTGHVSGGAAAFSLSYGEDARNQPITLSEKELPGHNEIYRLVADYVETRSGKQLSVQSYAKRVSGLLRNGAMAETEIANHLNLSARSLRRHLEREGQSFRDLLDQAKNYQAQSLILGGVSIAAIAEKLGYADERSLRRAFVRWNNMSPARFRERRQPGL
ncbi:MAG: helix-turn-helix domain-containing protein [Henriciella sp.]